MNFNPQQKRQSTMIRWILGLGWLLVFLPPTLGADDAAADGAYQTAVKAYQSKSFDFAEREFGEYASKFPQSSRLAEVILLRAQCRFELKKYDGVVELLTARLAGAGPLADQYRYLMAEAHFQKGNFESAAQAYADVLREFPNSPRRLASAYGEAFARFKLNDFKGTEELLRNPAGAFQQAALKATNEIEVIRGYLLLGDAYFELKNYPAAEAAMIQLGSRTLIPEMDWRRQYLMAMSQRANRQPQKALQTVTNLVHLARAATNPVWQANSLMFRADILETQRPEDAIATYEAITQIKGIPTVQSRQAALKIAALYVGQNRLTNAIARLENYAKQFPPDPDSDVIRLTLGELYLKRFRGLIEGVSPTSRPTNNWVEATNSLLLSRTNLDFIIAALTNSSLLGRAYLNRGWCSWEEAKLTDQPVKFDEGQKDFQKAAGLLPISDDQVEAWFKTADCQFELKDYANAIKSYQELLRRYANFPSVKTNSFDRALYQIVRAGVEAEDFGGAQRALDRLLKEFPKSELSDDCLYVFSQALLNHGKPAESREALMDFQKRFGNSPLLPDARLLVAHTYVGETNWTAALAELNGWVAQYPNHSARPRAEFDRAWFNYRAHNETNALVLYTNFFTQFPTNPLAPLARLWVGDYHYLQADYNPAEAMYQQLFQGTNAATGELKYRAWLMAAKAAFLRLSPKTARAYLTNLLNDPNRPQSLVLDAYFVLGDVEIQDVSGLSATNLLDRFANAINSYSKIVNDPSAGRLEPLARGRIADCHYQLAVQDTNRYVLATNEWHKVLDSSLADVTARSHAEVGLAKVYEKLAAGRPEPEQRPLLERAWDRYRNVVFGYGLKGEKPDPYWVKEAGLAAGQLAVRLQKIPEAIGLYDQLMKELPSLRETWEKKLNELRQETVKTTTN